MLVKHFISLESEIQQTNLSTIYYKVYKNTKNNKKNFKKMHGTIVFNFFEMLSTTEYIVSGKKQTPLDIVQ